MEKYIITALIVWIIISTVLLLFVIISVSTGKRVGRQRAGRVCEFFEKNKLIYSTAEKSAVFF